MAREPVAPEPGERRIRLDGETSGGHGDADFIPFGRRVLPPFPGRPGGRGGSKPDLTTDQARRALLAVASGAYHASAARYIGISPEQFSRYMHRKGEPYETFASWVREAEGYAETMLATMVFKAGRDDWKAALAFLERRYPERWAKVIAQPGTAVNFNFSATVALQKIEERARAVQDPRGPRQGQITLSQVIEAVRGDQLALPPPAANDEDDDDMEESA